MLEGFAILAEMSLRCWMLYIFGCFKMGKSAACAAALRFRFRTDQSPADSTSPRYSSSCIRLDWVKVMSAEQFSLLMRFEKLDRVSGA